ncbi:MAG: hypothetical protein AAGU19_05280 [Prolixibacteraceae bacterium]
MDSKLNRRVFLTTALTGIGAAALSGTGGLVMEMPEKKKPAMTSKRLYATTDVLDNILINYRGSRYGDPVARPAEYDENFRSFMDRRQLEELHRFLASVGVTRHQWIVDTIWNLEEDYPHRFDLMKEAAKSAHQYGIEFYAEIKPFEGGGFGNILPSTMPAPAGIVWNDLRGIFPAMRPFVAANPHLNLKRKAETCAYTGPVSAIRLVKSDDRPTRLKAGHLSIWTSATNNRFIPYTGPVTFRETIEKRYRFPYWRQCRILHLEKLNLPEGHAYVLIKCKPADGSFSNEKGNILELVNRQGQVIPHTLSTGPVSLEEHEDFYRSKVYQQIVRYLQLPKVQAELNDPQRMKEHYRDYYAFGAYNPADWTTPDKEGYVAAVCGKPEYLQGQLNPAYPEVREHWLEMIRFCLDRGVDGINLRHSSHVLSPERWEYGFNEPVLKASGGRTDFVTVSRINGDAYTLFLKEASKLVKSRGKALTIHLETELLMPDDRPGKLNSYPFNFEWQWEKWVREIGDEFEIRGIYQLRPWHMDKAIDVFSALTRASGKPVCLQGDFHGMAFDGPFASIEAEMDLVKHHENLDGYIFYETANITRLNDEGKLEASPEAAELLKSF